MSGNLGIFIARVVMVGTDNHTLGVYSPKHMSAMAYSESDNATTQSTNLMGVSFDTDGTFAYQDSVTTCNYIVAKAFDTRNTTPELGANVFCMSLTNIAPTVYWLPFNPGDQDDKYSDTNIDINTLIGNSDFITSLLGSSDFLNGIITKLFQNTTFITKLKENI